MSSGISPSGYIRVYALAEDKAWIEQVQRATLGPTDFGISLDNGLFGTEEWWSAVRDGRLPLHVVRGTISDVSMAGMNDYPVFKIRKEDGSETDFITRLGTADKDALYMVGKRVIYKYVVTRFKKPLQLWDETDTNIIETWDDADTAVELWVEP